jgi:hypothetical protein
MLHDIGLAAPVPRVDFTMVGARAARDLAVQAGLSSTATDTLLTAITLLVLTELLTNAIEHANAPIRITLAFSPDLETKPGSGRRRGWPELRRLRPDQLGAGGL